MRKIEKQYRQVSKLNKELLNENSQLEYEIDRAYDRVYSLECQIEKKNEELEMLRDIVAHQKKIIDKFFNARF